MGLLLLLLLVFSFLRFRLTNPQMLSGIDTQNIISQYDSVYHKAMEALNVRSDGREFKKCFRWNKYLRI